MVTPDVKRLETELKEKENKYLIENPEVKEALDIFGIAERNYQKYLRAQEEPRFYTSHSTSEVDDNGKLD